MRKRLLRSLIPFGLYPHINFTYSPFKVLEFGRIMDRCNPQGTESALDIEELISKYVFGNAEK